MSRARGRFGGLFDPSRRRPLTRAAGREHRPADGWMAGCWVQTNEGCADCYIGSRHNCLRRSTDLRQHRNLPPSHLVRNYCSTKFPRRSLTSPARSSADLRITNNTVELLYNLCIESECRPTVRERIYLAPPHAASKGYHRIARSLWARRTSSIRRYRGMNSSRVHGSSPS